MNPELSHLRVLAQIDELVARLSKWAEPESAWQPLARCRALVRRLLGRVETLRVRMEAPLVVATFGGTGTGKSSLVNALVGEDVTEAGRQRPTTRRPVLIVHPQCDVEALNLPLEEFEIVRADAPVLRDLVIVDCPDPDTTEVETPGSNLQRLHQLLPHCDVLLYVSTQQKYRSARVTDELAQAASGCRIVFVQTHADVDSDVRADWRRQLAEHYEVPDVFFVDSLRALSEQRAGRRPSGEFGQLQDLLTTQLAASQRVRIRRANLLDLLDEALRECRRELSSNQTGVDQLQAALEEQRQKLTARLSDRLCGELLVSRSLWERRLLSSVTHIWGFSPFSAVLRIYLGLGNLIAGAGLFRARNSAQMALIGALQGARWLKQRRTELDATERVQRVTTLELDDEVLRESQLVMAGYVQTARLDPSLAEQNSLDELREHAAEIEDRFLGDAGRRIDDIIDAVAVKNTGFLTRIAYETLFLAYVGFILYRVGKNFFVDSFLYERPLLTIDFYIPAALFLVFWSALLVMFYTRRLRRGLSRRIEELSQELARERTSRGLFPRLEAACREIEIERGRLDAMADAAADLRRKLSMTERLGSRNVEVEAG